MSNLHADWRQGRDCIAVRGARANNLKSVDLDIPYYRVTTFCGLSGSGKSSMALDVLYAEGQRRYVECFSPSMRAKLERVSKPDVDEILGLLPAIAVTSFEPSNSPRATLGYATEAIDYLRDVFAQIGVPYCESHESPREIKSYSPESVARTLVAANGAKATICFEPPLESYCRQSQDDFEQEWRQKGFHRVVVSGKSYDLQRPEGIANDEFRLAKLLKLADGEGRSEDEKRADAGFRSQSVPKKFGATDDADANEELDSGDAGSGLASGALLLDPALDPALRRDKRYVDLRVKVVKETQPPRILFTVDRVLLKEENLARLIDSVETAYAYGEARCWVIVDSDVAELAELGTPFLLDGVEKRVVAFSRALRCHVCGDEFPDVTPNLFNPECAAGACDVCGGLGVIDAFDESLVVPLPWKSIRDGAIVPWKSKPYHDKYLKDLLDRADVLKVRVDVPFNELTREERAVLFDGSARLDFIGLNGFFTKLLKEKYKMHIRGFLRNFQRSTTCPLCNGARLRLDALRVKVAGRNIAEYASAPLAETFAILDEFQRNRKSASRPYVESPALERLLVKLRFLKNVGLGYLTLNRPVKTLSSGELRRASFAKALASDLVDMLYVLDEPTNGLHPADADELSDMILDLRDRGNTVVVVDHNESVLKKSDGIVEFGPEAGQKGGKVVFQGNFEELKSARTLTGRYLSGGRKGGGGVRRPIDDKQTLKLVGASGYNLQNVDATFPLHTLCVTTGVSGAGKSALVCETLYPAVCSSIGADPGNGVVALPYKSISGYEKIVEATLVDQTPIGRSPRSNPVTFLKIFDDIRAVYAEVSEAKMRGYNAGFFSFNVDGGRCDACKGEGFVRMNSRFLSDDYAECPDCGGKRYKKPILDILYRGRSIADALEMSASDAFVHFRSFPKIQYKLKRMIDVGLGYLKLGQPANKLSGGEAQRLKLASYLASPSKGERLFIMDELSNGLHFADVVRIIDCLNEIVDSGNSVILIDHNPLVMKAADYIVDIGPGAGEQGGLIVAQGVPEEIAKRVDSATGRVLASILPGV